MIANLPPNSIALSVDDCAEGMGARACVCISGIIVKSPSHVGFVAPRP
jgi:hypothetical protein